MSFNQPVSKEYIKSITEGIEWDRYANFKPKVVEPEAEQVLESTEVEVPEEEVLEEGEEVEGFVCPLCESHLEEEVSEDRLAEHISDIFEAAGTLLDEDTEE